MGMAGIGEAVAEAEEGMMALTTRRCMWGATGMVVDAVVEGMAAAAAAAVEEEEEEAIVEAAVAAVVDATERL